MKPTPRLAATEWSRQAANGEVAGVGWVDAAWEADAPSYVQTERGFTATALGPSTPPAILQAAREAAAAGQPTLAEALQLVLARVDWLVETRGTWWTAEGPVPGAAAPLLAAAGLGAEVHRLDPDVVRRLLVRLPSWRPRRGVAARAVELVEDVLGRAPQGAWLGAEARPDLRAEVLAARPTTWWDDRASGGAPVLQVRGGYLRFQDPDAPWPLLTEDVLVAPAADTPPDPLLPRLLPASNSARVALPEA